jgi:hypothetical protein
MSTGVLIKHYRRMRVSVSIRDDDATAAAGTTKRSGPERLAILPQSIKRFSAMAVLGDENAKLVEQKASLAHLIVFSSIFLFRFFGLWRKTYCM